MTLFGNIRLGRATYALLLALLIGFDFVKAPVERYVMARHDAAAARLMEPKPAAAPSPRASADPDLPLMLDSQRAAVERMKALGRPLTEAEKQEFEKQIRREAEGMVLGMGGFGNADQETRDLAIEQSFFFSLYPIIQLLMGLGTLLGVLWLVSGRVRDIGWPQAATWLVLAPLVLPRFLGLPLPAVAAALVTGFGLLVLLAIAVIPAGGFGSSDEDEDEAPPPSGKREGGNRSPGSRPASPRSGQFGKLGVNR